MVRCSIARCVAEPCGVLCHLFLATASPPFCIYSFCVCLFVSVCRDFTGPSRESCQHSEDKLWCLCRELVLGEQLFGEQILINGRMRLVFYLTSHISVNLSVSVFPFSFFFFSLSVCVWLLQALCSRCRLTHSVPQHRVRPTLTSDMQSI